MWAKCWKSKRQQTIYGEQAVLMTLRLKTVVSRSTKIQYSYYLTGFFVVVKHESIYTAQWRVGVNLQQSFIGYWLIYHGVSNTIIYVSFEEKIDVRKVNLYWVRKDACVANRPHDMSEVNDENLEWIKLSEDSKSPDLDYRLDVLNQETNLKYLIPNSCLDKTSDVGICTDVGMWLFS